MAFDNCTKQEEWIAALEQVACQTEELMANGETKVTCECGKTVDLFYAYRCLYCEIVYCRKCAEIHFGQTVEDYKKLWSATVA